LFRRLSILPYSLHGLKPCKNISNKFIVSIANFKATLINHDVHYINDPIRSKMNDNAGYALGWGDLVIDRWLPYEKT